MRNRIFEIVVYLIDCLQGDPGRFTATEELWEELEAQGYSDDEISSAYSWFLKRFGSTPQRFYSSFPREHSSQRILTVAERRQLTTEAHGFLIKLLNHSLLNDEQLEAILDHVSAYGPRPATLDHIKLIASSVLISDMDEFAALAMFDTKGGSSHLVN
ncbi:MAG: DUF494 family protein [Candidatus Zixiibacteriota bacterium]